MDTGAEGLGAADSEAESEEYKYDDERGGQRICGARRRARGVGRDRPASNDDRDLAARLDGLRDRGPLGRRGVREDLRGSSTRARWRGRWRGAALGAAVSRAARARGATSFVPEERLPAAANCARRMTSRQSEYSSRSVWMVRSASLYCFCSRKGSFWVCFPSILLS